MPERKTDITENGAVELEEDALDQVAGGAGSDWKVSEMDGKSNIVYQDGAGGTSSNWKVNGFDGKGNDVLTAESTVVAQPVSRK